MARIVVVGGGVAGLAVAYELSGQDVTVLEAGARAGGTIRSERVEGYLCESGPVGFTDEAAPTLALCERLALLPRLTGARREAESRFVVREGRPRRLPSHPLAFLASDALSLRGRLRVLAEPLVRRREDRADESIARFARRRLGQEAAEVLVDALVTGIWAGDPDALSVGSALPTLARWERDHGGLLRGALARRERRGRLASFPSGLSELPEAIASALGSRLRLESPAVGVERRGRAGFDVLLARGAAIEADAVVVACPSFAAAPLLAGLDAELSRLAASIPWAAVAVVHLGFDGPALSRLRGFGILAPRRESASALGALVPSNIFPSRAPQGHALVTVMLGGARDPEAVHRSDAALIDSAASALGSWTGGLPPAVFAKVVRHPRAIPQYTLGHAERLSAIEERVRRAPGLVLTGSSYRGISVNACIADATAVAASLLTAP